MTLFFSKMLLARLFMEAHAPTGLQIWEVTIVHRVLDIHVRKHPLFKVLTVLTNYWFILYTFILLILQFNNITVSSCFRSLCCLLYIYDSVLQSRVQQSEVPPDLDVIACTYIQLHNLFLQRTKYVVKSSSKFDVLLFPPYIAYSRS